MKTQTSPSSQGHLVRFPTMHERSLSNYYLQSRLLFEEKQCYFYVMKCHMPQNPTPQPIGKDCERAPYDIKEDCSKKKYQMVTRC